jgi:trehalose-6-phosphate synthase
MNGLEDYRYSISGAKKKLTEALNVGIADTDEVNDELNSALNKLLKNK